MEAAWYICFCLWNSCWIIYIQYCHQSVSRWIINFYSAGLQRITVTCSSQRPSTYHCNTAGEASCQEYTVYPTKNDPSLLCFVGCNLRQFYSYPSGLLHWPRGQCLWSKPDEYEFHKISNISCTISQNSNDFRLVLHLFLSNPLKPGVKSRMKIYLEQHRQAMLQLHLSDQSFNCLIRCDLYYRFDGKCITWI